VVEPCAEPRDFSVVPASPQMGASDRGAGRKCRALGYIKGWRLEVADLAERWVERPIAGPAEARRPLFERRLDVSESSIFGTYGLVPQTILERTARVLLSDEELYRFRVMKLGERV
jgi:hypothetical protein